MESSSSRSSESYEISLDDPNNTIEAPETKQNP